MSLTPTEALTAVPPPTEIATETVPEPIFEVSLATTSTSPVAWTFELSEMWASTFMRTKFRLTAPAPALLVPPAPAAVTLTNWPLMGTGKGTITPAKSNCVGLTIKLWLEPAPGEVRKTGWLLTALLKVAASLICVASTAMT